MGRCILHGADGVYYCWDVDLGVSRGGVAYRAACRLQSPEAGFPARPAKARPKRARTPALGLSGCGKHRVVASIPVSDAIVSWSSDETVSWSKRCRSVTTHVLQGTWCRGKGAHRWRWRHEVLASDLAAHAAVAAAGPMDSFLLGNVLPRAVLGTAAAVAATSAVASQPSVKTVAVPAAAAAPPAGTNSAEDHPQSTRAAPERAAPAVPDGLMLARPVPVDVCAAEARAVIVAAVSGVDALSPVVDPAVAAADVLSRAVLDADAEGAVAASSLPFVAFAEPAAAAAAPAGPTCAGDRPPSARAAPAGAAAVAPDGLVLTRLGPVHARAAWCGVVLSAKVVGVAAMA